MADAPAPDGQVQDLAVMLGVPTIDRELLERALVHRSWAFEHDGVANERLEFLGDAVLGLVAADEIFHLCPGEPEGRLASLRAAAVSQPTLAGIARSLGLGGFIRLGVGEARSGGADKDSLLSDALEAILAAIHVDLGFTVAYDVAQRLLAEPLADLLARQSPLDAKTVLQEFTEADAGVGPEYRTSHCGPDHQPVFSAEVCVGDVVAGSGEGATKKAAERAAATAALKMLAPGQLSSPVPAPPVELAGTRGQGRSQPGQ